MRICAIGLRGIPDVMGGIETHCEHLYPRLAKLDGDLDITVIGRGGYAPSGNFGKVRLINVWAPKRKALETLVHTPLAILYARLFLHPHLIHLHAVGPGFFAPLARLLGFRVLATHHATDYDRPKWGRFGRWFLKTGENMIARFANDVICVSGTIEAGLAAEHPSRSHHYVTIRNGAPPQIGSTPAPTHDVLAKLGVEPGEYVLAVGRLDATKGFHELVRAFQMAAPKDFKLVIAGAAPDGDAYGAALKKQASDNIILAGALPAADLRVLYRKAGLFVHPSHMEGFPLVVLEAVAADAPLLLSRIAPHVEFGLDDPNYFETGNVAELAERLSVGNFDHLRATRRADILAEGDWDLIAERHRDILVRHGRSPARKQRDAAEPGVAPGAH
jgi:glycosyltransferase involved in cell wall biosynthesis